MIQESSMLQIKLPKSKKNEFTKLAYSLGTNPTNLIIMFINQVISAKNENRKSIIEMERFSLDELEDLKNDKRIQETLSKIENLFA